MNFRLAEIGIVLLACSVFAYFFVRLTVTPTFSHLVFSGTVSEFAWLAILDGPSILLTIAGLAFYSLGKNEFWKGLKKSQAPTVLLLFLSSSLFGTGVFLILVTCLSIGYYTAKLAPIGITFSHVLTNYIPELFWLASLVTSEITLIIDCWKNLPSKTKKYNEVSV